MIPIATVIRLKRKFAIPICLFALFPLSDAAREENVVPMFAPKIIAKLASNHMTPLLNAANVMTPTAPLECTTAVIIIPIKPKIQIFISLYFSRSNIAFMTSIFSLKKLIPRKNNPNPISHFAQESRYLLSVINKILPPNAISGMANTPILNSCDHNAATMSPVAVEPIFAQTITPTAFNNAIDPVATNHKVKSEISVLLFNIPVMVIPVNTAFRHLSVYFCKIIRSFGHQSFLIASSNISSPKSTNPSPASNFHRSIND